MARKIEKEVKRFVSSYKTQKGIRWRLAVPDGRGGQIREQAFLEESHAIESAKKKYSKVLLESDKISCNTEKQITFNEYSRQWLEMKRRDGLAGVTVRRYADQIRDFLDPFFSGIKLNELQKFHLRNYVTHLQDKNVTTYNVRSTVILFKMILKQAIQDDFMSMSEILLVKNPKHRPKEPKFWDHKEMNYFLNATSNSRWFKLWKFVLWTGLRAGEVSGLKWDCVHLDMKSGNHVGYLNIRRTSCQKTCEIKETTKNGDRRMVPIFPELRKLIVEMMAEKKSDEFVFGGEKPIDSSHFSRFLKQDLNKIPELKKVNFHGLRHTFCSYLDSSGMPRRILAEIMGHRDLSTTDRYSHVSNQTLGYEVSRWTESQNQQYSNNILEVAAVSS